MKESGYVDSMKKFKIPVELVFLCRFSLSYKFHLFAASWEVTKKTQMRNWVGAEEYTF